VDEQFDAFFSQNRCQSLWGMHWIFLGQLFPMGALEGEKELTWAMSKESHRTQPQSGD